MSATVSSTANSATTSCLPPSFAAASEASGSAKAGAAASMPNVSAAASSTRASPQLRPVTSAGAMAAAADGGGAPGPGGGGNPRRPPCPCRDRLWASVWDVAGGRLVDDAAFRRLRHRLRACARALHRRGARGCSLAAWALPPLWLRLYDFESEAMKAQTTQRCTASGGNESRRHSCT